MTNMNDRYSEEYDRMKKGIPLTEEPLEDKKAARKKRRRREILLAALLLAVSALSWYFFYYTRTPRYAVREIRDSVREHDLVTFHKRVDLDGLLSKGFDAVREAEWQHTENGEFSEEDKPTYVAHMKEVVENGIRNGDWSDSYRKSQPEKALKVNLGNLSMQDIRGAKESGNQAFVNVVMENEDLGSRDNLVLRLRKGREGWKLEEIMNLTWYYGKILDRRGEASGKTAGNSRTTPSDEEIALYQAIRDQITREVPEAKVILEHLPEPGKENGKSLTKEEIRDLPKKAEKVKDILDKPIVGSILRGLLEHQSELEAKTRELLETLRNGNETQELMKEISHNQQLLKLGNQVLHMILQYM